MDFNRRFSLISTIVVFLAFILTVYLSKDFLIPVMLSVVFVFLLKPIFSFFLRITRIRILSSALSILAIIIIILIVLSVMAQTFFGELFNIHNIGFQIYPAQNASQDTEMWIRGTFQEPILTLMLAVLHSITQIISNTITAMIVGMVGMIGNVPLYFAQSIVIIFFTFFMLYQGHDFARGALVLVPAEKKDKVWLFFQELSFIYTNIFTAYVYTAIASGILAFIAFTLLKIPYPLVLAGVVVIFTLIPLVGAIWDFIPLAFLYYLQGNYLLSGELALCGILIFVVPQYLILPRLAQRRGQIHPLITVLAFLGPLFVLGLPGVVIGPILYGFLLAVYRTKARSDAAAEEALQEASAAKPDLEAQS